MEEALAYDPAMDKVLKTWKCNETGLVVSINRYGTGEAKDQIGPRILFHPNGTDRAPVKAGRLHCCSIDSCPAGPADGSWRPALPLPLRIPVFPVAGNRAYLNDAARN